MRFAREFPLLLGWLVPYGIAPVLLWLLGLPFRGKNLDVQADPIIIFILLLAFYLLITFLMFVGSIKNVVLPLYQKNKIISSEFGQVKLELHMYFLHWLLCWVYAVLFSLPLLCWAAFFPWNKGILSYTWQAVASYFAYRFVVKQWIMEETKSQNRLDGENPILTV